jgi:hypothetical protein
MISKGTTEVKIMTGSTFCGADSPHTKRRNIRKTKSLFSRRRKNIGKFQFNGSLFN